jgi:hypothetical protein
MIEQIPGIFEAIVEPDGRVAVYLYGKLLGHWRDQTHADDWLVRWDQNQREISGVAWAIADELWPQLTPEERRAYNQPRPEQVEAYDQAA